MKEINAREIEFIDKEVHELKKLNKETYETVRNFTVDYYETNGPISHKNNRYVDLDKLKEALRCAWKLNSVCNRIVMMATSDEEEDK